jgi:vacuole morphology and inheritance protein 14
LIGLAATAIALMEDTTNYLELLLPPVLRCFTDQESRVRYYACEALYNITKVARGHVLLFFNEIFDGLCKLYADVDPDVKNGAQLLDRLVKDVVTESEHFDIVKFVPLLRERIKIRNPFIRQLLVGWIIVLDSVPAIDMLEYLPDYLAGLFDMLADPNKDIRQQSYAALSDLLREITQTISGLQTQAKEAAGGILPPDTPTGSIDLPSMIVILVATFHESRDNLTRLTALTWLNEFLLLGGARTLLPFVPDVLGAALYAISDAEKEIRQKAERSSEMLLALVSTTQETLPLVPLLEKLTTQLHGKRVPSRLAALRWISMLLSKLPGGLQPYLELSLFPVLLRTLQDADDLVVKLALEVLARICLNAHSQLDPQNFSLVTHYLLSLFRQDRKFLEIRGSFIIRSLCELLDAEEVYRKMSSILAGETTPPTSSAQPPPAGSSTGGAGADATMLLLSAEANEDFDFTALMVQTLNLILLTAVELAPLRSRLKACMSAPPASADAAALNAHRAASTAGLSLFRALFISWVHNPISTFALCLLTQTYRLSSELILRIAAVDMTVSHLMQVDKLIQLLESPIFIHLRLQLLEEPTAGGPTLPLLKSLYGILMLLPQSTAFTSLKTRLESVAPLVLLVKGLSAPGESKSKTNASSGPAVEQDVLPELLTHFEHIQSKHVARRRRQQKSASLLKPASQ